MATWLIFENMTVSLCAGLARGPRNRRSVVGVWRGSTLNFPALWRKPAPAGASDYGPLDRDAVLHRRRWTRRHDARLSIGARRRRRRRAGKARRLLSRFPRRHGASLDPRAHVRARAVGRVSQVAASEDRDAYRS